MPTVRIPTPLRKLTAGKEEVSAAGKNVGELIAGTVPGAVNIPLAQLPGRLDEIPRDRPVVVHCAGGYRSSVAASVLRKAGWSDVSDLLGGFNAWALAHRQVA